MAATPSRRFAGRGHGTAASWMAGPARFARRAATGSSWLHRALLPRRWSWLLLVMLALADATRLGPVSSWAGPEDVPQQDGDAPQQGRGGVRQPDQQPEERAEGREPGPWPRRRRRRGPHLHCLRRRSASSDRCRGHSCRDEPKIRSSRGHRICACVAGRPLAVTPLPFSTLKGTGVTRLEEHEVRQAESSPAVPPSWPPG